MADQILQVQKRMLISLAQVAKGIDLHEGDHISVEVINGGIFLRPVAWHDKSQEYFWTEEWQKKVKRSQQNFEQGKYKTFDNVDDLIKELGVNEDADTDS